MSEINKYIKILLPKESTDYKKIVDTFFKLHKGKFSLERAKSLHTFQLIKNVLEFLTKTNSIPNTTDHAQYLFDLKREQLSNEFIWIRYTAWLIPTIGFLGTVMGISQGISGFESVMGNSLDGNYLSGVTRSFGMAFNTTFAALFLSTFLIGFISHREKIEEKFLSKADQLVNNLLNNMMVSVDNEIIELQQVIDNQKEFIMSFKNEINSLSKVIDFESGPFVELLKSFENLDTKVKDDFTVFSQQMKDGFKQINLVTQSFEKSLNIFQKISKNFFNSTEKIDNFHSYLINIQDNLKAIDLKKVYIGLINLNKIKNILENLQPNINEILNKITESKLFENRKNDILEQILESLQPLSISLPSDDMTRLVEDLSGKINQKLEKLFVLESHSGDTVGFSSLINDKLDTIIDEKIEGTNNKLSELISYAQETKEQFISIKDSIPHIDESAKDYLNQKFLNIFDKIDIISQNTKKPNDYEKEKFFAYIFTEFQKRYVKMRKVEHHNGYDGFLKEYDSENNDEKK